MQEEARTPYRRVLSLVAVAIIVLLSSVAAFEFAFSAGIRQAREDGVRRLQIFDRTLEANIERFHYLPAAIAQSSEVRTLLQNPDDPDLLEQANGYLSRLNSTAVSDELFVVNVDGKSVAASNWWSHVSLVGHAYGERPYFIEAMGDGDAKYYAIGVTTQVPGYFLATRIEGPDGPLGVAVVKINIGEIEAVWWRSGELLGMFDVNDVAILSTRPDWRYRPLADASSTRLAALNSDQRYFGVPIEGRGIVRSLEPWRDGELAVLRNADDVVDGEFLVERQRIPLHGWQLLSFTPLAPVATAAWAAAGFTALGVGACLAAGLLFVQRQALMRARLEDHAQLEDRVRMRTYELQCSNERLNAEILEREQAERERAKAQEGLVQAAKLASLGQALAGVAHEVSQPIAALRTQASSAKLLASGQAQPLQDVLRSMDGVIGRLSDLTSHLKTFARRESAISIQSDGCHIVANAVELAGHLAGRVTITVEGNKKPIMVIGNPVHIEQILINLITNAADAMDHLEAARILIRLDARPQTLDIHVIDSGTGISDEVRETLFDPFVTTKEPGRGLGLGLSISYGLARDMDGSISYSETPGGGTTFTVTLPRAGSINGRNAA